MTVQEIGHILVILWTIESCFGVLVTAANLGDALEVRQLAREEPHATAQERQVSRAHVTREALRLVVAMIFVAIAVYSVGTILGFVPATGGLLVSIGLVISNGIIVVNSLSDRRLRRNLRRRITDGK